MVKELYTPRTIVVFAVASTAVTIACNALGHALKFNPRWLPLVFAQVIAYMGVSLIPKAERLRAYYIVAFFNGCLIYCQTVGINAMQSAAPQAKPVEAKQASVVPISADPWWLPAELKEEAQEMVDVASTASIATSNVVADLKDIGQAIYLRRVEIQKDLETTLYNLGNTRKALGNPFNQSEYQSLTNFLAKHLSDENRLKQELAQISDFESLMKTNVIAKQFFGQRGDALVKSQNRLVQATADLRRASADRKTVPW